MANALRKEVLLRHPPADVWAALTDPRALAEWLMPNNFTPVVGSRFRFQVDPMPGFSGINECTVLAVDAPRRLSFDWVTVPKDVSRPRPKPMVLTWTLVPEESGTRLILEQTGLDALNLWWRFSMTIGWSRMLKTLLPKVLRHVSGGIFTPGAITRRDYKSASVPKEFSR